MRPPRDAPIRLCAAVALIALFYALWLLYLPTASGWSALALRVVPRVSVFALGLLLALLFQGGANRSADASSRETLPPFTSVVLFSGALLAATCAWRLLDDAGTFEILKIAPAALAETREAARRTGQWSESANNLWFHARQGMFAPGAAVLLLRFVCAMLAAVFLGLWTGRGARYNWHFLALIFCAAVCDAWLNFFHVSEHAALGCLRLPFLPALPGFVASPAWTDIFFASAVLESARRLQLHPAALALCAVAGYCSAAWLSIMPGITVLSMALMGSAVMAGAWPDLKLTSTAVGKAFLTMALMLLMLSGFAALQRKLNPPPKPINLPEQSRNVAINAERIFGYCHSQDTMNRRT